MSLLCGRLVSGAVEKVSCNSAEYVADNAGQASVLASIWALPKVFQLNWGLDSPAARRNAPKRGGLGYDMEAFDPVRGRGGIERKGRTAGRALRHYSGLTLSGRKNKIDTAPFPPESVKDVGVGLKKSTTGEGCLKRGIGEKQTCSYSISGYP
ncbi:MAG TPA: hypothetical protein PKB02_11230 [Anaerohalosphaeraceae bacterium]|nr:hypothetical protein [Anaerohalosphaeraceae bacterium]